MTEDVCHGRHSRTKEAAGTHLANLFDPSLILDMVSLSKSVYVTSDLLARIASRPLSVLFMGRRITKQ